MTDPKVDPETCENEFARFLEAMGLDLRMDKMDESDRKSLLLQKERITSAMAEGSLIVDAEGCIVFTPKMGGEPLKFREPTGASMMAIDQKKAGHDVTKMFAFMADITQQPEKRFATMRSRDLKVCQAVTMLFLG